MLSGASARLPFRRPGLWLGTGLAAFLFLGILGALALHEARPRLDAYLNSGRFRRAISEETSRGLKVEGEYSPLSHEGWLAWTAGFESHGRPGEAIAGLRAETVTARFNPWGLLRRLWEVDRVTIDHATLELRRPDDAEKTPLTVKKKPWYSFLMPQRFYLKLVDAQKADILWTVRGQPAGIREMHTWVTPYGKKDWRFQGVDGRLDIPGLTPLRIATASFIVTKPTLFVESAELASPDPSDRGRILLNGTAGLQPADPAFHAEGKISQMPLTPWLTGPWAERLDGRVSGDLAWDSPHGTHLSGSKGSGALALEEGVLARMPLLDQVASLSKDPSLREIRFETVRFHWTWNDPVLEAQEIEISSAGVLRLEGALKIDAGRLSGDVQFGIRPQDIAWLPKKGRGIFDQSRPGSDLAWTTVHFSGTTQKPEEDFTPRVRKAITSSPFLLLKIALEQIGI